MSTAEVTTITADDLLSLPEAEQYELVHGQLVERTMGQQTGWIAAAVITLLGTYLLKHPIGDVYSKSCSYRCFPHEPEMVRRPDVSLILHGRLPLDQFLKGHARIVPDLVVEVLSPNDLAYDVTEKIHDYFRAGVPLIWEVSPSTRSVTVYEEGGRSVQLLQHEDRITGGDVLPGFECCVSEFFPPLHLTAPMAGDRPAV